MKNFFTVIPNNTNIDFVGKFKIFIVFSLVTVAISIVGMFTKGFNFGVDFTGGVVTQVKFKEKKDIESVRKLINDLGYSDASVVSVGQEGVEYIITVRSVSNENNKPLHQRLVESVGKDKVDIQKADSVGPKVGKELKGSALRALIYSVILIMVYIWFRFDLKFAPGATVAMIHDIIIAAGFYVFTGREFTITSIAALLTIAGYSVNDTIVIYDRVRELFKGKLTDVALAPTINHAINLTLSRTLLTSLLTFISIIPLAIFCSGEIQSFSLAMLVGIFVGSYSTIYIAAPMTIFVQRFLDKKA